MSFRKVELHDEEDKIKNTPTQTEENNVELPVLETQIENKITDCKIDENFYKFVENIIERVLDKKFRSAKKNTTKKLKNKKVKEVKKVKNPTKKQLKKASKPMKDIEKAVKISKPKINWIF